MKPGQPKLTLIKGGLSEGPSPSGQNNSDHVDFSALYPDVHQDNFQYIQKARELTAQSISAQFPGITISETELRHEINLPSEYKNHPQHVWFGFRDRIKRLIIIRFERNRLGEPDLKASPMVDPQVKILD